MYISLGVIAAVYVVWVIAAPLVMPRPTNLGIQANGQLADCPDSPNCVSSFVDDEIHGVSPMKFDEPTDSVFRRLIEILENQPGVEIVKQTDGYLHAECTTPLMRYIDDLECLADSKEGVIHVRSASRLGYSDLGKNRQRIEKLREELNKSFKNEDTAK